MKTAIKTERERERERKKERERERESKTVNYSKGPNNLDSHYLKNLSNKTIQYITDLCDDILNSNTILKMYKWTK